MRRLGIALAMVTLAGTAGAVSQVHYVMGTYLRIVVDDEVPPSAFAGCFEEARALDRTFSRFDPSSELVRLNAAGSAAASVRFRDGLVRALRLAQATGGTFDVTVGALAALWRLPGLPSPAQVRAARRGLGAVAVSRDRVVLGRDTRLDFDGLAKGIAVDACVAALRAEGISRALVSFGESSLSALGAPRDAPAWIVEVRGSGPDCAVARLALRDTAAAVSAVYGGAGRVGARPRGHIVDPRSGRPLATDDVGVVVAANATDAEAYAKAVVIDGSRGLAAMEAIPGVLAARITRGRVDQGRAMRAAGVLEVAAHPYPIAVERAGLR